MTNEWESSTGPLSWEDPSLRAGLPNPIQRSVGNNSRTLPPQTMHCCCLDESVRRHPGLFFPHPPFQALFQGRGRCCSQLGALEKNFPSTFPLPGKDTGGSRQEVSPKPAGSTRGCGVIQECGSEEGMPALHPHHQRDKAGIQLVAQAPDTEAWGELGSQSLAWKPGWGK